MLPLPCVSWGKWSVIDYHKSVSNSLYNTLVHPWHCPILSRPNFLILDEPTNHLDLETVEALANALKKFKVSTKLFSYVHVD